jgi:hypothetical protein
LCITIQGLLRSHFDALVRSQPLSGDMLRAAVAQRDCRTLAMGVHVRRCPEGHFQELAYNSCGHRCCQQCNSLERERWLDRKSQRLLPCPHHHVVFTVPHELLDLWRYNKRAFANLLFASASQALRQLLADPKYCGARVGMLAALHTWSQTLAGHVHLHVLVSAGGLSETGDRRPTVRDCLLPRKVLMLIFRGKFRDFTLQALAQDKLALPPGTTKNQWIGELNRLGRVVWNVKVFDRYPHGRGVAKYLAHYMRGGPIGNSRLLKLDGDRLTIRYRVPTQAAGDRTRQVRMVMSVLVFLRLLLEHVPPRGLQTIRGYGLYAGNQYSRLSTAFEALGSTPPDRAYTELDIDRWLASLGVDPTHGGCPICGRRLEVTESYRPGRLRLARSPPAAQTDHSPLTSQPA